MGTPVVVVDSGGAPVRIAVNGLGVPVTLAGNGRGVPVTFSDNGAPIVIAPFAAETTAYIARMTVAPPLMRQAQIDALIKSLKGAGVWSNLAVLRLGWNHDAQSSLLNMVGNYANATATNSPSFTASRGFIGNGTNAFLDYGVGYAGLPLIGLTDHTDLVWSLTDLNSSARDAGGTGAGGTTYIAGLVSGTLRFRANQATNSQVTANTSLGLYGFSRTGSTVNAVKNGVFRQTTTVAATAFETGNVCDLRSSATYSLRRIGVRVIGKYMDATKQAALYGALLMDARAVGAVA